MKWLVTAGPTQEALDPVRYLGNRSSGKLGYALATEIARQSHDVILVAGPTTLPDPHNVTVEHVVSAAEMDERVAAHQEACQVLIMSAAVADWTPVAPSSEKIRKESLEGDTQTLTLKRTTDILARLGVTRRADQLLVGFCLETRDHVARARIKCERKGADLIFANDAATLGADEVSGWLVDATTEVSWATMSKMEFARRFVEILRERV